MTADPAAATGISGTVAPGFEPVRRAFAGNFAEGRELGAACTVFHRGQKVVDLWGGTADRSTGAPWREDTLVLVYSLTKGMSALSCAVAVSKGLFAYDTRVAEIWPEFAANGKAMITVRDLLSERAGLPAIDLQLDFALMADQDRMAATLAAQAPSWVPGDYSGNHALTLGWLASELIRRTDPHHRTLGEFFRAEIAQPLGADFHIGLPESVARSRLARIVGFPGWQAALHPDSLPPWMLLAMAVPWSITSRTLNNPKFPAGPAAFDQPAHWQLEDGGAGGMGNARALAKIYHEVAAGSPILRVKGEVLAALAATPEPPRLGLRDQVLKTDIRYSLGLEKRGGVIDFDGTAEAFGTFALGGSFAFASPGRQLSYAYVTNKLGFCFWGDPREKAIRTALLNCGPLVDAGA